MSYPCDRRCVLHEASLSPSHLTWPIRAAEVTVLSLLFVEASATWRERNIQVYGWYAMNPSYGAVNLPEGGGDEYDEKNTYYLNEKGCSWNRFVRAVVPIIIALFIMAGLGYGMSHGWGDLVILLATTWTFCNDSITSLIPPQLIPYKHNFSPILSDI